MNPKIKGSKILIIGGTGSLGTTLCRLLGSHNNIIIFSRDENKQWLMKQTYPEMQFMIGDMRDSNSVSRALHQYKPDIVIIAAALKHIDICENNVQECIATNITGINNVLSCIGAVHFVKTCLFISTDKACSPVNVYGMCKSLSERCVADAARQYPQTRFVLVRYGNVICSRGSLIPKLKEIITAIDELPITDINMTRFFMTLEHAVELIETAILYAKSGETFLPDIKAYKIYDIFNWWATKYNKPIKVVGHRQGEKVHEMLINETECMRTEIRWIDGKKWFAIVPTHLQGSVDSTLRPEIKEYESSMVEDNIDALLPYF